ncbi:MAG: hypothetical protein IPG60_07610 [Bacteroidetes bacterium]|nr:hypothetical protein [Bacteroidota bacterium]
MTFAKFLSIFLLINIFSRCKESNGIESKYFTNKDYLKNYIWFEKAKKDFDTTYLTTINISEVQLWKIWRNNISLDTSYNLEFNDTIIMYDVGYGLAFEGNYSIINKNTDSMKLVINTEPPTFYIPCRKDERCDIKDYFNY